MLIKHGGVLRTHFDATNWEGLLHNGLTGADDEF